MLENYGKKNMLSKAHLSVQSRQPGKVWGDRRGDEGLHRLPVDLLEHEQDLWALGDEFTFTARVEL